MDQKIYFRHQLQRYGQVIFHYFKYIESYTKLGSCLRWTYTIIRMHYECNVIGTQSQTKLIIFSLNKKKTVRSNVI